MATPKPNMEPAAPVTPPVVEPDPPTTVHETVLSLDLEEYDIEGPVAHERVPDPPKIVQRKLQGRDMIWRWLSKPHVDARGPRQYIAYSPDSEDRKAMERGDCPPGVHVSVDNRLCWGVDSYLGYLPRRFYEARQAQLAALRKQSQDDSQRGEAMLELARRAGAKKPYVAVEPDNPRRSR